MAEKKSVLIVDDEAPIRATLTKFLKTLGVEEILEAQNGGEAIDQVKKNPGIRLVIMDLKMPTKDGLKALEEIRGAHPALKIAILTGYPFYGEADQAVKKWNVFDFISKPIDLDYLERLVTVALSDEEVPKQGSPKK
ncbi:MAG: response regulator [Candidatus Omnitrophica bacterium]|nr:response regulator [Candidatus Omnitrophota bacterium]